MAAVGSIPSQQQTLVSIAIGVAASWLGEGLCVPTKTILPETIALLPHACCNCAALSTQSTEFCDVVTHDLKSRVRLFAILEALLRDKNNA